MIKAIKPDFFQQAAPDVDAPSPSPSCKPPEIHEAERFPWSCNPDDVIDCQKRWST
jgi:hypothetical protein